jgi:hypothetical protein
MDDFGSQSVELYIYDMTQGMAQMMSPLLLGKCLSSRKSCVYANIPVSDSFSQVVKSMEFGTQL